LPRDAAAANFASVAALHHLFRGGARALALLALAGAAQARPAGPSAGPAPATSTPGPTSEAAPVRIQFPPGSSSASVSVEFPSPGRPRAAGPGTGAPSHPSVAPAPNVATTVAERQFVVAARAGQTLKVVLGAPAKQPALELSVLCPGDGHTDVGRNGRLQGSVTLPESGDYRILVSKIGGSPTPPAVLDVEVTGSPNRIAARPYTGTYYRQDGSRSSIDVREVLGAGGSPRLRFLLVAFWGAFDSPYGPNLGTAQGEVTLQDGVGLYEKDGCRLTFRFGRPGTGDLHVDEAGDCGLGHKVTARGDYRRTSLCSAPEEPIG
jgi:hypothetical protein